MNVNRICMLSAVFAAAAVLLFAGEEPPQTPLRSMKYTSRPGPEAAAWQQAVRARLFRVLKLDNLLAEKKSIPFSPRKLRSETKDTYEVSELEINTTPNRRMRIIVTVPRTAGDRVPAVVCLGGHGSTLYSPYDESTVAKEPGLKQRDRLYGGFATRLASRGYVTIGTTVSQHTVYEAGRLLMGERLWDAMRCVDYLESMPGVDRSRIGCAGLSLGGEMTMWLGSMDTRISATISAGFLTSMDHMEQNHCMCWKFPGLRELVDYADLYALIAPRPLQCQNGLKEPPSQFYVPLARQVMEEIRVTYRDLDRPENVVLDVHEGAHVVDVPGLLYFFEKHLYGNRRIPGKPEP